MMTLAAASAYFDRTEVFDAYSGAPLFLAQVDPYDDSKRDAMVAYRRVLSVAPGVAIPEHRAIRIHGHTWLVAGQPEVDGLEQVHRVKYVLQASDGLMSLGTITNFLDGAPASQIYGFPSWVKDAKQTEESSDMANLFEVILPAGAQIEPHEVLWRAGEAYLALAARRLPSDFIGVNAVRLDQTEPLEATVQVRTYNPVAGAYTLGATSYPYALRVRWQSLFKYDAQRSARYQEGDFTLAFPEETEINTSTRIGFEGQNLSVLGVTSVAGAVAVHVRKA